MKRIAKWLGIGVAAAIGLLVLAAVGIFGLSAYIIGQTHEAKAETLEKPSAAMLADAPRQARTLACMACHGEQLQGKVMFDAPNVAKIVAPNLPLIASRATDQQLAAAIRQGVGHDGRALFVMPSQQYSHLADAEVAALIAYIRRLPRKPGNMDRPTIRPLGRLGLAMGKFSPTMESVEDYRRRMPIPAGGAHSAGRRLVAKHCSECHGPALEGQEMFDMATPDLSIAAAYDYEQFRTLLRSGTAPGGKKLGLMKEVAETAFVGFTDAEIQAMHGYLRARAEKVTR